MTNTAGAGSRVLGTLAAVDGRGSVRMTDRFDTAAGDLWAALTDPVRLARWLGDIDGDLRPGGEFRAHFLASGWEGVGRIEVCEPPVRLLVRTTESGGTDAHTIEVTLTADDDATVLVVEERGMPLEQVAGYGAGVQVHVEDLAAHLAGRERCDSDARMAALFPAYEQLPVAGG